MSSRTDDIHGRGNASDGILKRWDGRSPMFGAAVTTSLADERSKTTDILTQDLGLSPMPFPDSRRTLNCRSRRLLNMESLRMTWVGFWSLSFRTKEPLGHTSRRPVTMPAGDRLRSWQTLRKTKASSRQRSTRRSEFAPRQHSCRSSTARRGESGPGEAQSRG